MAKPNAAPAKQDDGNDGGNVCHVDSYVLSWCGISKLGANAKRVARDEERVIGNYRSCSTLAKARRSAFLRRSVLSRRLPPRRAAEN